MTPKLLILYVDDEVDLLEIGKLFLEQSGEYSIDTAISASEALIKLEQKKYDAVVSDYQMPEMDGIKFLQVLRNRGDQIPFIIFTGRGREEVILEALNSGVDFYLQKGGDPKAQFAELKNIIGKSVRQKSADEALIKSEARYRSLVNNLTAGIFRSSAEEPEHWLWVNQAFIEMFGYDSLKDCMDHTAAELYFDDRDREQFIRELNEKGFVKNYELHLKKKDGTPIWVSISSQIIRDSDGQTLWIDGICNDITDRKKTDDELRAAYEQLTATDEKMRAQYDELKFSQDAVRESEKKFQSIVQGSPIPQFVIDNNHHVISWNRALEEYSNVHADEVLGTTSAWKAFYDNKRPVMADLLVDEDIQSIPKWYAGKYSPSKYVGGAFEATDFFPNMGTNGIWLYFTASVIRDTKGTIVGAVETLEDVTTWKRAQEEIQNMSEFQQSVISNANVWLMVLDHNGTIRVWNTAAEEISGYSAAEVINNNGIWKLLYPDKEYRKSITKVLLHIINERKYLENFETRIRTKAGKHKTILWNTRNLGSTNDQSATFVAIGVDITKSVLAEQTLRENETKLNAIVKGSPIPQFVIDKDHKIIFWNTALERYSGIKAEDVIGTNQQWRAFYPSQRPCMADLLVDGELEKIPQWYEGKFAKSVFNEDAYEASDFFPHMGPSGTWMHFTAAPIRDINGPIIGAVETLEDITERKHSEEALQLINKKLNLMSSVTRHDILNQLTALGGYLALLKQRLSEKTDLDYVAHGEDAVRNIERQILFTGNYQEIGVQSPKWQNIDAIIRQALSQSDPGPVAVEISVGNYEVYADSLLVKIFFNLIDNSLRHGEKNTKIRFYHQKSDNELIIFCEDDGIGIPHDKKERIFERGVGNDRGYGLFLAQEILSITGLSIKETGTPGTGARFEIHIPTGKNRTSPNASSNLIA